MQSHHLPFAKAAAMLLATLIAPLATSNAAAQERRDVYRACCDHADISVPTATGCVTVDDGVECADDTFVANCSDSLGESCWPIANSGVANRFSTRTDEGRRDGSLAAPGGGLQSN